MKNRKSRVIDGAAGSPAWLRRDRSIDFTEFAGQEWASKLWGLVGAVAITDQELSLMLGLSTAELRDARSELPSVGSVADSRFEHLLRILSWLVRFSDGKADALSGIIRSPDFFGGSSQPPWKGSGIVLYLTSKGPDALREVDAWIHAH